MESGSTSGSTSHQTTFKMAEFIGTLIAVLTLALPTVVVTRYSTNATSSPSVPYAISRTNNNR